MTNHKDSCVCPEHKNMVSRAWLLMLVAIFSGIVGYIAKASASVERVDAVEIRVVRLEKKFDAIEQTLRQNHRETMAAIREGK